MKIDNYDGRYFENCSISVKIDGVRAHCKNGVWKSRSGKPLYNLPLMDDGIYEVFLGDFINTISAVRTKEGSMVSTEDLFRLDKIDERLQLVSNVSVSPSDVKAWMAIVRKSGNEGLIIIDEQTGRRFKVKQKLTEDVIVTGVVEGTGKYKGKLGALITNKGKVGTGFRDIDRVLLFTQDMVGKLIEVSYMELTKDGKFRHPAFEKVRYDIM
jgi:hypothetical protein